jgi:serine protease
MLDAGAAVKAARNVVVARIAVTPAAALAGQPVELSAAGSVVAVGRTVAAVHWVITDGGGIVDAFSGGDDAMTASVVPIGSGRFDVSVTVTDNLGNSASTSSSIDVQWEAGGGALGLPWLLALFGAALAVRRANRPEIPRY